MKLEENKMKFQVIFTFDAEYQGYVAEVPALTGCLSQGKTMDEAIANIRDAIKGYLYVQEKHNQPVQLQFLNIFLGEVAV